MPLLGRQLLPTDAFIGPFGGSPTGPIDVESFARITGEDVAFKRLNWLRNYEPVLTRWHGPEDIKRMWVAVFRGALAHGVPLPSGLVSYARMLGVVIP
jgi:hypothetical protein